MGPQIFIVEATLGFPLRFSAGNTKMEFIAKGLLIKEAEVTIINSVFGEKGIDSLEIGERDSIKYVLFPYSRGLFGLLKNLNLYYKFVKANCRRNSFIIIDFTLYPVYLFHVCVAKRLKVKILNIYHEWHVSFKHKGLKKISNCLFDYTFGYFVDGILPISAFLEAKAKRFNKPILKVPILADFYQETEKNKLQIRDFFLYCGHTGYKRIIDVIIDAFSAYVALGYIRKLILVLSGNEGSYDPIKMKVSSMGLNNDIIILKNLPHSELNQLYSSAIALLVPLSPHSIQDQARFSQKIAEYLSSRRPIITTSMGEVQLFFKDKVTAFISQELSASSLLEQLKISTDDVELADFVGNNGYELGRKEFDYRLNGERLFRFINEIHDKKSKSI